MPPDNNFIRMRHEKCIFLDAGHGGINPKSGEYTTYPGKMYDHGYGNFHKGSLFYEGVKNRVVADMIYKICTMRYDINVVKVYHPYLDTPLEDRVAIANDYHNNIQRGIYFSEHSDACGGCGAQGISTFTYYGDSESDRHATLIFNNLREDLGGKVKRWRADYSDGDSDKESGFFVLKNTAMPSILLENNFFDSYEDAIMLSDSEYLEEYAESVAKSLNFIVSS